MQRRTFLKAISLTPLLAIDTSAAKVRHVIKTKLGEHPVAGYQFYDGVEIWSQLQLKQAVKLTREHDNDFDEEAIAVYWKQHQLGYVPHKYKALLTRLMDEGNVLSAEITHLCESHDPWQRIEIAIYLET